MQTEMIVQNPYASAPLRIPLTVNLNTPIEKSLANVLINSRRIDDWVNWRPAHDWTAVLCGGGPSLRESLADIMEIGGNVFALNGAASFLANHGIMPDYQVIMDAQPATAKLVGPARHHLFASQVDPACFDQKPDATLWHATIGEINPDEQPGFPEHDDYCLIAGSVSVGNTALTLLYVLGYRTIHVFGMDSSYRDGHGHAYAQAMNDGDPCTRVEFKGKEYVCSVTMHLQAKHFVRRAAQLSEAGCYIVVHGSGLLPDMMSSPVSEREKYQELWTGRQYREFSPGQASASTFLDLIPQGASVIDFGCGTGRAGLEIQAAGHKVTLLDFTDNCRDPEAERLPFIIHDLTAPIPITADCGFCADVMEHIPTEAVEVVIRNIMNATKRTFFQISTVADNFGENIGQVLHLTVRPNHWWGLLFERMGYRIAWNHTTDINSAFLVEHR